MKQNNTADLQTYSKAWYDKMVEIWRDRIDAMNILDTGALRGSVAGKGFAIDEMGGQMAFQFLQYGIFVDLGTGKGYKRGNGGELEFLGKDYRKQHNLGKARKKRPWFSTSWYVSTKVIRDVYARFVGDQFVGIMDNLD